MSGPVKRVLVTSMTRWFVAPLEGYGSGEGRAFRPSQLAAHVFNAARRNRRGRLDVSAYCGTQLHQDVAMGYVHTSATNMSEAISRLGGHKSGHSGSNQLSQGSDELAVTAVV